MPASPAISLSCGEKLYGRDNELRLLHDVLRRARCEEQEAGEGPKENANVDDYHGHRSSVQRVFLSGPSGTGKNALVAVAFAKADCLFGRGKFDSKRLRAKTFAALDTCIASVCRAMKVQDADKYKVLLEKGVGDKEIDLLCTVFPELASIVNHKPPPTSTEEDDSSKVLVSKESLEQFKFALRQFFVAISLPERPVVMFLDNLHLADALSMDILKVSVLSNSDLNHLVFVGSFRDDMANEYRMLKLLETLHKPLQLSVGSLDMVSVAGLLSDVLHVDEKEDELMDLAELIHDQAEGNILHILQLLNQLQEKGVLKLASGGWFGGSSSDRWIWDIGAVRVEMPPNTILGDLVMDRLQFLSDEDRTCVKLCSCFGFRCDIDILTLVGAGYVSQPIGDMKASLDSIISKGLLERCGEGDQVQFVHDEIYHAAMELFETEDEQSVLHFEIGMALWKVYGFDDPGKIEQAEDRIISLCAEHFNFGCEERSIDDEFRISLAKFNLFAGKRAAAQFALVPSSEFLRHGSEWLDPMTRWLEGYELALGLFVSEAEVCFASGQRERQEEAVEEVLTNARSIVDSFRAHMVMLLHLATPGVVDEQGLLIPTIHDVLSKLGEDVPSKPSLEATKVAYTALQHRLGKLSDNDILMAPLMSGRRKAMAVHFLSEMVAPLSLHMDEDAQRLGMFAVCHMVQATLDYGLAPHSPVALVQMATELAGRSDVGLACRMVEISRMLVHRPGLDVSNSKVLSRAAAITHWREPLSLMVENSMEAYHINMHSGDPTAAFQSAIMYCVALFYSGLPIGPLLTDVKSFMELMLDYGKPNLAIVLVPCLQCVLNLTGAYNDLLDLSGNMARHYRTICHWNGKVGQQSEWSFRMQLAVYCEAFDVSVEMSNTLKGLDLHAVYSMFFQQSRVFFYCLIAVWQARVSSWRPFARKSLEKEATKWFELVQKWAVEDKSVYMAHKLLILEAEMLFFQRNVDVTEVGKAYDKAIAACSGAGFLQDGALACQLASRALPEGDLADGYFARACQLYTSWGATAVVECLRWNRQVKSASQHSQASSEQAQSSHISRIRHRFDRKHIDDVKVLEIE